MFVATVAVGDAMLPSTPTIQTETPIEKEIVMESAVSEISDSINRKLTTKEEVKEYFSDLPILAEIAFCESNYRQFGTNGEVLRGIENPQDVGVLQINEIYHLETAQKLGLNLYTLEGNMSYGRYLYEKEGTRPWNNSSVCWGKGRDVAVK